MCVTKYDLSIVLLKLAGTGCQSNHVYQPAHPACNPYYFYASYKIPKIYLCGGMVSWGLTGSVVWRILLGFKR